MSTAPPNKRLRSFSILQIGLRAIRKAGGRLPVSGILEAIEGQAQLSERELARYERTGYPRWRSRFFFDSVMAVKAGWVRKAQGTWVLTPEGENACELPVQDFMRQASDAYYSWRSRQSIESNSDTPSSVSYELEAAEAEVEGEVTLVLETAEAQAREEIDRYVRALNPYEFQDLVAALLRGMGYTTPYVAAKGPDGGTDILAYKDPLGRELPHVRVQVKHRQEKARREEVAALRGIVRTDREVGLFVSTYGFSPDAVREARSGNVHIELIDLARLLTLWIENYDRLSEEDKDHLRLRRVMFLAPERT